MNILLSKLNLEDVNFLYMFYCFTKFILKDDTICNIVYSKLSSALENNKYGLLSYQELPNVNSYDGAIEIVKLFIN